MITIDQAEQLIAAAHDLRHNGGGFQFQTTGDDGRVYIHSVRVRRTESKTVYFFANGRIARAKLVSKLADTMPAAALPGAHNHLGIN